MYVWELFGAFPPSRNDIIHHVGFLYYALFVHYHPLATERPSSLAILRTVCCMSFFSLGLNSAILLVQFLMWKLGPYTRPPAVMCWFHVLLTLTMGLTRILEWCHCIYAIYWCWKEGDSLEEYAAIAIVSIVCVAVCSVHRRWTRRAFMSSSELWQNYLKRTQIRMRKDQLIRRALDMMLTFGFMIANGTLFMVVIAMGITPILAKRIKDTEI